MPGKTSDDRVDSPNRAVLSSFFERFGGFGGGIPTHDPSAIAYLIEPALLRVERMPIWVETQGLCPGQTVPDRRRQGRDVPEINVCLDVDSPRVLELFRERISAARGERHG